MELVIVFGDWLVDETWLVAGEQQSTSSDFGQPQYRSLVPSPAAGILNLCAAGGIAQMLHGRLIGSHNGDHENPTAKDVRLVGAGCWHKDDQPTMEQLYKHRAIKKQTPLTLSRPPVEKQGDPDYALININAGCCNGTWRVVRIFSRTGRSELKMIHRINWEVQFKTKRNDGDIGTLGGLLTTDVSRVHLVIVDHNKGTVNDESIGIFKKALGETRDVRIYARAKDNSVPWLTNKWVRREMRLLMVGPEGLALSQGERWFTDELISPDAWEWLKRGSSCPELTDLEKAAVVALHKNGNTAVRTEKDHVFTCVRHPPQPDITPGRHTVVFSSLVASLVEHVKEECPSTASLDWEHTIATALKNAYFWCNDTREEVFKELQGSAAEEQPSGTDTGAAKEKKETDRHKSALVQAYTTAIVPPQDLADTKDVNAKQASLDKYTCKVKNKTEDLIARDAGDDLDVVDGSFHIWRRWSQVDGVVALYEPHRREIGQLVREVEEFRDAELPHKRPLSALIVAPPGAGKSFLVKGLARQAGMDFLQYNITHLTSQNDLISCFDQIASRQNQDPDRKLLVFWDEINANIGNSESFGYFLGPISDGLYRRGGSTFRLDPCVWIFAGTEKCGKVQPTQRIGISTTTGEERNDDKVQVDRQRPFGDTMKGSDFVSRLNGPVVHLGIEKDNQSKDTQLQQLYTSMALLLAEHPSVTRVSRHVLKYFKDIKPTHNTRSIEFIISRIKGIRRGEVKLQNLPIDEEIHAFVKGETGRDNRHDDDTKVESMVDLVARP